MNMEGKNQCHTKLDGVDNGMYHILGNWLVSSKEGWIPELLYQTFIIQVHGPQRSLVASPPKIRQE